ncbi:hypothetical protein EJB05_22154 [Eragrostis curvula]|uniref:Uncharacterized protein n=1 Tax=Eragrostis curvula TaxID=38414 RepID=A0A5J9V4R9_9POAL|nr:hypothetical protein EJB05_22154 [Eragrostis curvula]
MASRHLHGVLLQPGPFEAIGKEGSYLLQLQTASVLLIRSGDLHMWIFKWVAAGEGIAVVLQSTWHYTLKMPWVSPAMMIFLAVFYPGGAYYYQYDYCNSFVLYNAPCNLFSP